VTPKRRVWLSCPPGYGHLAMVGRLAQDLAAENEFEVTLLTSPAFVSEAERHGIQAIGVGRPWAEHEVERGFPELVGPDGVISGMTVFVLAGAESLRDMVTLAEVGAPDAIVFDWPTDYAGAALAQLLGVPGVAMMTSEMVPPEIFEHMSKPIADLTGRSAEPVSLYLSPFPPALAADRPAVDVTRVQYSTLSFDRETTHLRTSSTMPGQ
jgi:UDP:flavonoid glycosyltransferase YjiC (YdhE family)